MYRVMYDKMYGYLFSVGVVLGHDGDDVPFLEVERAFVPA